MAERVPTQSEQMQARIAVALQRAEAICAKARAEMAAERIGSGPQSEAQWLDAAIAAEPNMSDDDIARWAEVL